MERVMVVVVAAALLLGCLAAPGECMNYYGAPYQQCGPKQCIVTKMVPCVRTEMVAEVQPATRVVNVQKTGFTVQNVMLKGTPIGSACGQDPCTKCCPQPFCEVVQQKVPYTYCEPVCVPYYNVVYRPVCRQVMMPQNYLVTAHPMCGGY